MGKKSRAKKRKLNGGGNGAAGGKPKDKPKAMHVLEPITKDKPKPKPVLKPVLVEFKFSSCKTALWNEDGQMTGTLHIPMLQDPHTGRYQIPAGKTHVKGLAKFRSVRYDDEDMHQLKKTFTASFERPDADSPLENFRLGYLLR